MNDSINEKLINIETQIENIELQIKRLTDSLYLAKREVQSWVETNSDLSISAQKARAETQAMVFYLVQNIEVLFGRTLLQKMQR